MQSKILTTLLTAIPFFVFSQNYKPAKITTLSGQQKQVEIQVENWKFNPKVFKYRTSEANAAAQLSATNTATVEIADEFSFESAEVQKSLNKVRYPDIPKFEDSSSVKEKVFLKLIYHGEKLSLYSFTDELKERFYVKNNSGSFEELKYRVFYSAKIDFRVETQYIYKTQLLAIASALGASNTVIAQKIQSARYNARDLLSIFKSIDGNKGVVKSKVGAMPLSLIVGAGVGISTFKLSSNEVLGKSPSYQSTSAFPLIGLNYTWDYQQKSMLQLLISASRYKAFFSGIDEHSEETKGFTQTNITIAPMYLYNFYKHKNLGIFLAAGLGLNFPSYKDDVITWKSTEIPNASTVVRKDVGGFQGFGYLLPIKMEISVSNFQLGLGYTYSIAGITDSPKFEINTSSFNCSLQYIFSKKK